jgi:hypothetical protein
MPRQQRSSRGRARWHPWLQGLRAGGGGEGGGGAQDDSSLWWRTDESRAGSLPTRAAYGAPAAVTKAGAGKDRRSDGPALGSPRNTNRARLDQSGDARVLLLCCGRPVATPRRACDRGPLGRFAGGQYLVEPGFAVPAGPLEIVRLESPDAPRWIQAEEEEDPFRTLARLRSDLQRLELQLLTL